MAITLAEAKVGMANKVDQQVIDTFRRSSLLLDRLVFDNAISPGTGGSTLTYGYVQLKTPSTAAVRTINSEYTPGEAKREEKTAKAIIMGGSFEIDRVIAETSGAVDEIAFQAEEKIKATSNYFSNLVINGTSAVSGAGYVPNTFDGLKKLLNGTDTAVNSEVDLSTSALTDSNYNAFLDELDAFLALLDGKPDLLLMNDKMLLKVRSCARRAGYYDRTKDDFGRVVETYNGIPMMDCGKYYDGTKTVDIVETTAPSASAYGTTDIYAVSIGANAFCGISPTGNKVISAHMPDLNAPGAVKKGDVELVAGVALKNTRKAGVLKGIKILPKSAASGT
ncbi:MAG: phage capsid protein [Ruminiclostridium sp.]|nr:phage capsid protein [Ruminiclostridium sp.]